jgi:hypothetical protein
MVQLLGMVLDFLDALAGAVAIACWWCTWVRPAKQPEQSRLSEPTEIDDFLREARPRVGVQETVSVRSRPPAQNSDVMPPA